MWRISCRFLEYVSCKSEKLISHVYLTYTSCISLASEKLTTCKILISFLHWTLKCRLRQFIWAAPSEFGTYRLCEQRRFRRACASVQSRQNLRCSLIQAVSQEEPSTRKPDPWSLWLAGHAQLKFVMTECSKHKFAWLGPFVSHL